MATGRFIKLEAVTTLTDPPLTTIATLERELIAEGCKVEGAGYNMVTVTTAGKTVKRWECWAEGRTNA
jgi:hypothetical protein